MKDKELLQLAAKGAGYDVVWNDNWNCFQHKSPVPDKHGQYRHPWVPLEDGGDALRLAVDLRLALGTPHEGRRAYASSQDRQRGVEANCGVHGLDEHDPFAATCRAIVRAAAEIGKSMS